MKNEEEEEFLKNKDVFQHMNLSWSGGYLSPGKLILRLILMSVKFCKIYC